MIKFTYILFVLLLLVAACNSKNFDKERWLLNNDVNDSSNPRSHMTDDLIKNHLKVGLTRNAVLVLLGKPYKDGIENRLSKGLEIPAATSLVGKGHLNTEGQEEATKKFNEFVRLNSKPETLMWYPVGWSTIDPNFLIVKFNEKGLVSDFWVEQH